MLPCSHCESGDDDEADVKPDETDEIACCHIHPPHLTWVGEQTGQMQRSESGSACPVEMSSMDYDSKEDDVHDVSSSEKRYLWAA